MSEVENQEHVQLSSESDPEQIDLDELNDIKVDPSDLDELNQLFATTKIGKEEKSKIKEDAPAPVAINLDAFLRNFFIRNKMTETLQNFQQEWYEIMQTKGDVENATQIPQQYIEGERLREETRKKRDELDKAIIIAQKARGTYDKLLKERNFYKMHHQRVQQEKKKLNMELERLRNDHLQDQKKYDEMAEKYSNLMKQKMMIKLERDRLKTRTQIQKEMHQTQPQPTEEQEKIHKTSNLSKTVSRIKLTPFPPDDRESPYSEDEIKPFEFKNTVLYKTHKGHQMSVSGIALHPKKPMIATVSDDMTWKLWTVPQGELIMCGQGHKEWLSSIKFHPSSSHIVTSSGDGSIKMWDFSKATCSLTLTEHTQSVWQVDIHDLGDFIASASMDHLAKVYDINAQKCRHSLRGHVDSVNSVKFQPFSNIIATASADKTVSLWDMRTSLCVQTFYGHNNSVNGCAFNPVGDKIASCDSDGIIKVWDVRMVKEKDTVDFSQYSANRIAFDNSGTFVGAALDNGEAKVYNLNHSKFECTLKGHDDAVQDIVFDHKSKAIYTCGSDCTFRVWQ